ncbi:MAG: hypothetical protein KKF44_04020 [Nanoarchaeota archaeon]|nr:hypothetical protein [Nanoarchaeota archaeon]
MSLLVNSAYRSLYGKECPYETTLKYSRAFSGYNANVRYSDRELRFRLSYKWKEISPELKTGLVQNLLNKVFKTNVKSIDIDMYNIFLKKVHITIPKTETDPVLENSFNKVNDRYFYGMIERPNLRWGTDSLSKLGSYEYGTDSITISKIMAEDEMLLDYVMYHEILHKKLKFKDKNGRSYHHTREFRAKEKDFEVHDIEEKLKKFLRRKRARGILGLWKQ